MYAHTYPPSRGFFNFIVDGWWRHLKAHMDQYTWEICIPTWIEKVRSGRNLFPKVGNILLFI